MCGIIGYTGGGNAAQIIYEGLKNLEYRGYDSAGMAIMENGACKTVKSCGRVEKLGASLRFFGGHTGIGHTRWATHGKPSNANAHPHTYGRITVVHNGIIENYAELRQRLTERGEIFLSETDSEVIAHLIDGFYDGDLIEAVIKCADMLKGSYALLCLCEGKEEIAAAKCRSPVILGLGENCNYLASDMTALAGKCKEVCVLEDGDFALVTPLSAKIYDGGKREITRAYLPNLAEPSALALGGFPHFMVKELWEAPATVKNTITAFCGQKDLIKSALSGVRRIVFTGCGTAYHAALAGKRYIEEFAHIPCETDYAGELRYKTLNVAEKTALIAITQSGETADTVEAARLYKSQGCTVLAVTNSPYSAITRIADVVVPVAAGAEIGVAATKSYSGQIAALYMLASLVAEKEENFAAVAEMPKLILKTLEKIDIYATARLCAESSGVYFLGRDIDYAVALEGSLKLKEVSYIPGCGYPASELKHGPLALIDGSTLSVFVITDPDISVKAEGAVEQVLARRGKVAVITGLPGVKHDLKGRAEIIELPRCDKYLSPLLSAAALQLLAYRTAVILGCDPDKPRNLAKSVTVE